MVSVECLILDALWNVFHYLNLVEQSPVLVVQLIFLCPVNPLSQLVWLLGAATQL